MTATLVEPHLDDPGDFGDALQRRLADHQYQAMTDDAIMGEDLALASCVVCRDPVPDILKDPLLSSGFTPEEQVRGGQIQRSLFGRLGGSKQRARLEKWSVRYARSGDLDDQLGAFESALVDEVPDGTVPRPPMRHPLWSSTRAGPTCAYCSPQPREPADARAAYRPAAPPASGPLGPAPGRGPRAGRLYRPQHPDRGIGDPLERRSRRR